MSFTLQFQKALQHRHRFFVFTKLLQSRYLRPEQAGTIGNNHISSFLSSISYLAFFAFFAFAFGADLAFADNLVFALVLFEPLVLLPALAFAFVPDFLTLAPTFGFALEDALDLTGFFAAFLAGL